MSDRFVQVKGHHDLVRDTQSNAIINKNRNAYDIAKKRIDQFAMQKTLF